VSFVAPIPALEQNVSYGLPSLVALALVGVGLVDGMEVRAQANLAYTHLCYDGANCSMGTHMCGEGPFSGPHAQSKQISAVLGLFLVLVPFISYRPTNDGLVVAMSVLSAPSSGCVLGSFVHTGYGLQPL